MNKENILKLAAFIEAQRFAHSKDIEVDPEGIGQNGIVFNMSAWLDILHDQHGNACGTVMCIGGSACHLAGKKWGTAEAGAWLGVDPDTADDMFYPGFNYDWESITQVVAGKMLHNFVETGIVDWDAAGAERSGKR